MPQIDRIGRQTRPIVITCRTCGHAVVWEAQEARRRLGGDCMVTDARRRLNCSACMSEGRPAGFVDFA